MNGSDRNPTASMATVRSPGIRPTTALTLHNAALADGYAGLPPGMTRWTLAALLRGAARPLGLTPAMLRLLEHYIDQTFDQDWQTGSEPVVIRPLTEIAAQLGRSERQIRNIEQALAERGLLIWRDSANHRRWGYRDRHTGRLAEAYGPSLAPLGARASEIATLAAEARAEDRALTRTRKAIGAMRRRIRAALIGYPDGTLALLAETETLLRQRLPAKLTLAQLQHHHRRLDALARQIEGMIQPAPTPKTAAEPIIACEGEISSRPNTDTKHELGKTACRSTPAQKQNTEALGRYLLTPEKILRLAPNRITWEQKTPVEWTRVIEQGYIEAHMNGIDQQLWGDACLSIGRDVAAKCAIAIADKPHIRNPKAYFRALLERGRRAELHIDKTLISLCRAHPCDNRICNQLPMTKPQQPLC